MVHDNLLRRLRLYSRCRTRASVRYLLSYTRCSYMVDTLHTLKPGGCHPHTQVSKVRCNRFLGESSSKRQNVERPWWERARSGVGAQARGKEVHRRTCKPQPAAASGSWLKGVHALIHIVLVFSLLATRYCHHLVGVVKSWA